MKTTTDPVESARGIFRQYKVLAEKAMAQLDDKDLFSDPDGLANSIAVIVQHMSGNMLSRWTDFLTSDGEKDWRNRDVEFDPREMSRTELMELWEKGWECLLGAIDPLSADDIGRIVTIRGEEHSVLEAINRQIAHYSYHIGQIVYLAKLRRSAKWESLSIPRGQSRQFNKDFKQK